MVAEVHLVRKEIKETREIQALPVLRVRKALQVFRAQPVHKGLRV
jgi:hypothetical protein